MIALFTIIDHRVSKDKNGKDYTNQKRLYAAKQQTFEVLNKLASKLGGLAGQTFTISRSKNEKSPGTGDIFIPTQKREIKVLQDLYQEEFKDPKTNKTEKRTIFVPADYEKELIFRTGDELRKMGLGKPSHTGSNGGAPSAGYTGQAGDSKEDYDKHL